MYVGKSKVKSTCPICDKIINIGDVVWFDSTKSKSKNKAHKACFDKLLSERGFILKPIDKKAKHTLEELDPPF